MVTPHCLTVRRPAGFTYVGLMFAIALIGLAAAASVQLGSAMQRRQAEDELLFVGMQYKEAIRSYFEAAPAGAVASPPARLEDLLRDPRFPNVRRHLRTLYPDPITGKMDWVLIKSVDGKGILGLHSRSLARPVRLDGFPDDVFHFKGKTSYAQWVFVYGVVCMESGCKIDHKTNDLSDAGQ